MLALLTTFGGLFGLKGKVATAVGGVLSLLLLTGMLWGLKSCYDSSVIENARNRGNIEALEDKAKADANASTSRTDAAVRAQAEGRELEEAINEARTEGRDPRAAYYECVRLQQQARTAGRPTPQC